MRSVKSHETAMRNDGERPGWLRRSRTGRIRKLLEGPRLTRARPGQESTAPAVEKAPGE
jgi:hypothetical protein